MSLKRYLYIYFASVLLVASFLAAFNVIIDPYLMFYSERIPNFNDKKPTSVNRTQLFKPYNVTKVAPQTIVVGNSRPEMGVDPLSTCWQSKHGKVYSLTFPGLSAYEQIRALFHGVASGQVDYVLLGLDFADVLYKRNRLLESEVWPSKSSEFLERLLVDEYFKKNKAFIKAKLVDTFMVMFSLDALFDSIYTLASQSENAPNRTQLGFNPARDYIDIVHHEGEWVLFAQKLVELESRFSKTGMGIFDTAEHWSIELEGLKRTIGLAKQQGFQLKIFINPYHYKYLESIRNAGYWDEFEDFKRSLVKLITEFGDEQVELWDFSLYSQYTVSQVPKKGDVGLMQWFWEPAHYKAELGNVMLAEMFEKDCIPEKHLMPLGVRLNDVDIEDHLANQIKLRDHLIKRIN